MSYFNNSYIYTSYLLFFGGYYDEGASTGAFCLAIDDSAASSVPNVGGRLMFL